MNDDELRAAGPPGLSPERHQALREQLLATIEAGDPPLADEPVEASTERSGTRPSRRALGLVAAAVFAVAALAVATRLAPDDGATTSSTPVEVLDPNPTLASAQVPCVLGTSERSRAVDLSSVPADAPLSEEAIVEACAAAVADLLVGDPAPPPVLCRDGDAAVTTAAVVHVGASCELAGYAEMAPADLDQLDELRALEASLWAIADRCPDLEALLAWMREQVAATDLPVEVVAPADRGHEGCWVPSVDWSAGTVTASPQP